MALDPSFELVSFDSPPVEEVAFAAQFADPVFSFAEVAALRNLLAPRFPVVQQQPPLSRLSAPEEENTAPPFRFDPAQLPRLWFVASDGQRLVQIQDDRIAFNWRRLGRPTAYPRYPLLREEFAAILAEAFSIVGSAAVDVCELTYVNELRLPTGSTTGFPPLRRLVRVAAPAGPVSFLPEPDHQQWSARWLAPAGGAEKPAQLEVKVEPALSRSDQHPVYLLTMISRTAIAAGGEGVLSQLDWAHELIVRGFADLTTAEMHDRWGRTK